MKVNTNPEQKYFHHIDLVGSIRVITDSTGTVIASYEYEPFGVTVKTTGTDQDNLGFAGKRLDAGSRLSYFGARYYDSEMGRFISRDPAQDGRNWYVYCYNNPMNYVDPNGQQGQTAALAGSLSWLCFIDGPLPIGDILYGAIIGTSAAIEYGPTVLNFTQDVIYLFENTSNNLDKMSKKSNNGGHSNSKGKTNGNSSNTNPDGKDPLDPLKEKIKNATEKIKIITNDILEKPRSGSAAVKLDQYHAFNDIIDNYAGYATKYTLKSGATLYQLEGSLNGVSGRFEWIIDAGKVTHRLFVRLGTLSGVPIK